MTGPGDDLVLFDTRPYRETAVLLRERFVVPPFSVLDAGMGYWQTRKRNWLSLGIESEVSREDVYTFGSADATDEVSLKILGQGHVSVFDPVLCELVYRWWSPADGVILDPFAGGSVRGLVAAMLGRRYVGVELRPEQVAANIDQRDRILPGIVDRERWPEWTVGDSRYDLPSEDVDMVFSCPPYGSLERYSDDPADLSTMTPGAFTDAHEEIIANACRRLRPDRFAVWVVGNYLTPKGLLTDLAGATVTAFRAAGLSYYGDVILLTPPGSAAIRAGASFNAGRKPVRRHQYVMVFVKGDWHTAAADAEAFDG